MKSKLKVFVIDDNEDDLMMIRRVVSKIETRNKFDVACFTNAESARKALEGTLLRPPCVIIIDLNLEGDNALSSYFPHNDGAEARRDYLTSVNFIRQIRNNPRLRQIPIVVYTDGEEIEDIRLAWEAGANSYVTKELGGGDSTFMSEMESLLSYWVDFNIDFNGGAKF